MANNATPTIAAAPARMKGDTSKAKPQIAKDLGIALSDLEAMSICWVPVPMDTKTKHLLADVAEARDLGKDAKEASTKVHAILSKLATDAIESNREAFEKEASAIVRKVAEEKSEDELQKMVDAQMRKLEALKAALLSKKG